MGLFGKLQRLGCRLKLIQVVPGEVNRPKKIATKAISLKELMLEVNQDSIQALAQSPAELCIPFEKVFESAGIQGPRKGWDINRLIQELSHDKYESMDRKSVQQSLLKVLADEAIDVEDMVKDALARDRTLDAFEGFVVDKMKKRTDARRERKAELEGQIIRISREIEKLKNEEEADIQHLSEWQKSKAQYDNELTRVVEFLMECRVRSNAEK